MLTEGAVVEQHVVERPSQLLAVAAAHGVVATRTADRTAVEEVAVAVVAEFGTELGLPRQALQGLEDVAEVNLGIEAAQQTVVPAFVLRLGPFVDNRIGIGGRATGLGDDVAVLVVWQGIAQDGFGSAVEFGGTRTCSVGLRIAVLLCSERSVERTSHLEPPGALNIHRSREVVALVGLSLLCALVAEVAERREPGDILCAAACAEGVFLGEARLRNVVRPVGIGHLRTVPRTAGPSLHHIGQGHVVTAEEVPVLLLRRLVARGIFVGSRVVVGPAAPGDVVAGAHGRTLVNDLLKGERTVVAQLHLALLSALRRDEHHTVGATAAVDSG